MLLQGNELPKQVDWPSNESKQSAHLSLTSVRLIHRRLNVNEEHTELYVLTMVFHRHRNRQRNSHVILHTWPIIDTVHMNRRRTSTLHM